MESSATAPPDDEPEDLVPELAGARREEAAPGAPSASAGTAIAIVPASAAGATDGEAIRLDASREGSVPPGAAPPLTILLGALLEPLRSQGSRGGC